VAIIYREMTDADLSFLADLISASEEWREFELQGQSAKEYFYKYEKYRSGNWRVWSINHIDVAVSFHLDEAPSNGKPWLGTLLVDKKYRGKDLGESIIDEFSKELFGKGEGVIFCACPPNYDTWLSFLAACGFEQLKVERDDDAQQEYMILVRVLGE
jgi:GNAT superfamily N-acetyltransferase